MKTFVVLDLSVFIHKLSDSLGKAALAPDMALAFVKANLVWLHSGQWLPEYLKVSEEVYPIYVRDTKPYWRTEYLTRFSVVKDIPRKSKKAQGTAVHYKGGRKHPDAAFSKLKDRCYDLIGSQGWTQLIERHYEADDFAASLVWVNNHLDNPNRLVLATVDTDWLGLVNANTPWFCLHGHRPRVRWELVEINHWAQRTLKACLDEPRQIWDIKAREGDKSDNLPPGTPLEVIDLHQPPKEFRLWEKPAYSSLLKRLLTDPRDTEVSRKKVKEALDFLERLGTPPVVRPYDPDSDRLYSLDAA